MRCRFMKKGLKAKREKGDIEKDIRPQSPNKHTILHSKWLKSSNDKLVYLWQNYQVTMLFNNISVAYERRLSTKYYWLVKLLRLLNECRFIVRYLVSTYYLLKGISD